MRLQTVDRGASYLASANKVRFGEKKKNAGNKKTIGRSTYKYDNSFWF